MECGCEMNRGGGFYHSRGQSDSVAAEGSNLHSASVSGITSMQRNTGTSALTPKRFQHQLERRLRLQTK